MSITTEPAAFGEPARLAGLEVHRAALTGHCYRMLGSAFEADDAVQETMVRAWRGLERFDGRSAMRTWLYRIATNVCLDALASRSRRERPIDLDAPGSIASTLVRREREHWLEPVPDARVLPVQADPAEQMMLRQSVRLAFVAALQHLPPRQRAALLLTEVLGCSAVEAAECLETSPASINSALQRARATLARHQADLPAAPEDDSAQARLLEQYVDAFERYDVDALKSLLREDAALSMPPFTLWLSGPDAIGQWLLGPGLGCRGSRLVPTRANGLPAFGQYHPGGVPWALIVLELDGDRIAHWNAFLDADRLFPLFGLPASLPE